MKKILYVLLVVSFLSSCTSSEDKKKYFIEGTLKNSTSSSLVLEKLGMTVLTQIDSSKIDDKGAFKMSGISETGFYRLRANNQVLSIFLLEPGKYKFDIDAQHPDAATVNGPGASDEFQRAFKAIGVAQRNLSEWNNAYQAYAQQGASQDTLAVLAQNLQAARLKLQSLLVDSSKTASSPLVAMFYITNAEMDRFPKENLAVLERMEKEIPNSSYTREYRSLYNKLNAMAVGIGKPAPDIDLNDPSGKSIKLSSLKGKVVLLDFWASWCGPCRMEMPNVVATYNKYKDKGFTVYSVSLDKDADSWKKAIDALGMNWENQVSELKEWKSAVVGQYGIRGIPAAFLLDRNGVIVATDLRGEELDKKVGELLK